MTPDDLVLTPRGARYLGRHFPFVVGRGGTRRDKREGDGATPRGTHQITGMLYRPDRMPRPAHWAVPIGPRDLWSDDPAAPEYNLMVRAPYAFSHERLRRGDALYDLILLTDWNWPEPRPEKGSAIFLHRWRRAGYPTEGCIAFRPEHLNWIARHTRPGCRVIVP